jgi:peptidoglycan-N-acetylglucosamine deacetylase
VGDLEDRRRNGTADTDGVRRRGTRAERQVRRARMRRRRLVALAAIVVVVVGLVWVVAGAFSSRGDASSGGGSGLASADASTLPAVDAPTFTTDAKTPTTFASASATTSVTTSAGSSSTTLVPTTTTTGTGAAPVVRRGPTDVKRIALTFDDNYQLPAATATLAVLERYKVQATFFVIGHYVDTGPELAKAIAAGGFEVGDHTRSHSDCRTLSKHGLRIEIGNGTDHYRALTGAPTVPLFRPPTGVYDQKTLEVAAEKGFKYAVLWDVDTEDWRGRSADVIRSTVLSQATSGSIVLMHVAAPHTAEALPGIIEGLRAKGYELVSLTTLLGVR